MLDEDVVEELKNKENRSAFVNELLRDKLEMDKLVNMSREEILALKEIELKKIELRKEIEALNGN